MKIGQQLEIEVYTTVAGYVAIKQVSALGDDDGLVFVRPENVSKLCRLLRLEKPLAADCMKEVLEKEELEKQEESK